MARPRIWQRGQTGSYYATIGGKQVLLGRDEAEAKQRYDYLMGVAGTQSISRVDDLLDAFLEWVSLNRSDATYSQYRTLLKSFNSTLPATLRICDLKPLHISNWLDGEPTWNTTTKNKAVGAVKRAFNWALDQGHINVSPIARVKKPPVQNREILLTQKLWQQIGATVKDQAFRDFLMILRTTGCRPYEVRTVEAHNVRGDTWLFPKVNSKGKKYNRLVMLNRVAQRITQRLVKKYPEGPLFRNMHGKPWTKDAIVNRFKRLSMKLGVPIYAYMLRHTFCTVALERGVDSTTLATLMGHQDPTMVARVYSHLTGNKEHLRAALNQATGGDAAR